MVDHLFRPAALERMRSPEATDHRAVLVGSGQWAALAMVGLILLAALAWSLLGEIPTQVHGRGILVTQGGVRDVVSLAAGQIDEVTVEVGDTVRRGQVVARIRQPELLDRIQRARAALQTPAINQARGTAEEAGATGATGAVESAETRRLRSELDFLERRLAQESRVVSPFSGRVVEVERATGEVIRPGEALLSLEGLEKPLEALVYVDPAHGKRIRPGMAIDIYPSTVIREEYGGMQALVRSVSPYPASRASMLRALGGNQAVVEELAGSGARIAVVADPVPDGDTHSGYRWTTPQGPPETMRPGTLCVGAATVSRQRPITLVLPFLAPYLE